MALSMLAFALKLANGCCPIQSNCQPASYISIIIMFSVSPAYSLKTQSQPILRERFTKGMDRYSNNDLTYRLKCRSLTALGNIPGCPFELGCNHILCNRAKAKATKVTVLQESWCCQGRAEGTATRSVPRQNILQIGPRARLRSLPAKKKDAFTQGRVTKSIEVVTKE